MVMKPQSVRVILLALGDVLSPTLIVLAVTAGFAALGDTAWPLAALRHAWPTLPFFLTANAALGLYHQRSLRAQAIFSHVNDMRRLFATLSATFLCLLWLLCQQGRGQQPWFVLLPLCWLLACLAAMPNRRLVRQLTSNNNNKLCPEDILRDVRQCPALPGRRQRLLKTVLEALLAGIALLCCWPALLLVAALVKLSSPGPVIYRAKRLGKDGRPILLWKFRTMYHHADERLQAMLAENPALAAEWRRRQKLDHDPRVTPIGRFLRRSSMDELPQLLNIIQGDMAMIGPRPIVHDEVARYGEYYATFASVKPGITGLWQVSGRNQVSYETRVALDIAYIQKWSIWLDLYILQKTVLEVLRGNGS